MNSNDKLKEIDIKNCTFYFDDIIKIEDFDFGNILIDEKITWKYFGFWHFLHKILIGAQPLRIRFDRIDEFIKVYDRTRYLVWLGGDKYDFFYNRSRYLIGMTSCITYVIYHNYAKIKVDSYDSLSLEKPLTFHNVIILLK